MQIPAHITLLLGTAYSTSPKTALHLSMKCGFWRKVKDFKSSILELACCFYVILFRFV